MAQFHEKFARIFAKSVFHHMPLRSHMLSKLAMQRNKSLTDITEGCE